MGKTKKTPRTALPSGIGKVLKRLHYPLDVILLCVRWYVGSSRQGCQSWEVKVLLPSIARIWTDSISAAG